MPTPTTRPNVAREIRCRNPNCPSARYGRPALICIIEAPPHISLTIRTRCRRCKTHQRIHLPPQRTPRL